MRNYKNYLASIIFSLSFLLPAIVQAEDAALAMLKHVTTEMTTTLTQEKAAIKANPNKIVEIVDEIILPHIDTADMSRAVLARHYRTATPKQREEFQKTFERWAVLTYSSAFLHYSDQQIEFGKVTPIGNKGDRKQINSLIKQKDGTKIAVNYRLVDKNGEWKVYDINVENVSLVNSFRSQVSTQIDQKGLDKVIAEINKRNTRGLVAK